MLRGMGQASSPSQTPALPLPPPPSELTSGWFRVKVHYRKNSSWGVVGVQKWAWGFAVVHLDKIEGRWTPSDGRSLEDAIARRISGWNWLAHDVRVEEALGPSDRKRRQKQPEVEGPSRLGARDAPAVPSPGPWQRTSFPKEGEGCPEVRRELSLQSVVLVPGIPGSSTGMAIEFEVTTVPSPRVTRATTATVSPGPRATGTSVHTLPWGGSRVKETGGRSSSFTS
jgi:hypothetical protein